MKQVVYISSAISNQIEVWKIKKNKVFILIQTIKTKGQPQPLCINKKKKILYIGIRPNCYILCFKINVKGLLFFFKKVKIPYSLNYITLDKKNKKILCSSYHFNSLSILTLDQFGVPIKKSLIVFPNILGCHAVLVSNDNKKIFVTALQENNIYIYNFNNNINSISNNFIKLKAKKKSGPRHICLNNNGKYLYSLNELNGTIDIWYIKNFNLIKNKQNIKIIPKNINIQPWSSDIHIHPSGNFLYACDRNLNLITLFYLFKNGSFLKIKNFFITEIQPRSFNIDKYGKLLILTGEKSNTIAFYKINPSTGYIKLLKVCKTGNNPLWVLIHSL